MVSVQRQALLLASEACQVIGYKYLLPRPLRVGIKNVFINLAFPVRFVNNMFQGKLKRTGMELSRFLVNSTVGVLGLWDPATDWFHWKRYDEDFDQTLGVWHLGKGFYLTWPLLGPSSVRGTFGAVADAALDPVSYLPGGGVAGPHQRPFARVTKITKRWWKTPWILTRRSVTRTSKTAIKWVKE